jgi:dTDP-4-dehydrorhamnose 3,5-epimerase-like enzyme
LKVKNIWTETPPPLELHADDRGKIVDVFYREGIEHVTVISSKAGALRGNHYHKNTVQHVLVTNGSMEYWYKHVDSDQHARTVVLRKGDLVSTPAFEIHALRTLEDDTEFVVFSSGLRGGKDYESDTFRVPSIVR